MNYILVLSIILNFILLAAWDAEWHDANKWFSKWAKLTLKEEVNVKSRHTYR